MTDRRSSRRSRLTDVVLASTITRVSCVEKLVMEDQKIRKTIVPASSEDPPFMELMCWKAYVLNEEILGNDSAST